MIVKCRSGKKHKVDVSRDPNEKFKEVPRDIIIEDGDHSVTIQMPSGALIILHNLMGEHVTVYKDPERNPSLMYEITEYQR